ncbi:MAG TPA: hypothetical protein VJB59_01700 [Bdellovibrionota bacterium]|nr:hypothetical protein [Bdellovibrionota bacterium]
MRPKNSLSFEDVYAVTFGTLLSLHCLGFKIHTHGISMADILWDKTIEIEYPVPLRKGVQVCLGLQQQS